MTQTTAAEYLDIHGVSELYGTTPSALYTQNHRGEAPGCLAVKVGRKLVWRRSDLEAWWEARRQVGGG